LFNTIQNQAGGAVIAGGYGNVIQHDPTQPVNSTFANVAGGLSNTVSGYGGTIAGGVANIANVTYAAVSGGTGNTASGWASTVGGGAGNIASGPNGSATVGGGYQNTASGDDSTIPGGIYNTASGIYSFAAGYNAQALHSGSFVWSDYEPSFSTFASTAANQFSVRASGGIILAGNVLIAGGDAGYYNLSLNGGNALGYLYGSFPALGDGIHLGYNYYYDTSGTGHIANTGGATSRLSMGYGTVEILVGGVNAAPSTERLLANTTGVTVVGTFNNQSDRNSKQDFTPVSPATILDKVAQLPITEWSYKEDTATRHVGPVAQDFYSTFNIGTDDKHIAPMDEGGVALAAIKGLDQKLETGSKEQEEKIKAQSAQIQTQSAEIADLKKQNDQMSQRLQEIEQTLKTFTDRR
jgi:hypothetical protein